MVYTGPSCPVRLFTPIKKSGRVDFFLCVGTGPFFGTFITFFGT